MNDISEYNSNGWASVHEAAYAGSVDELNLIFEHARDLHRNVVDMKTVDDMKTTPLLVIASFFLKIITAEILFIYSILNTDSSSRWTHRNNENASQ
jgi:hypothetical protein